jgi:hypothetical protein
MTDNLPAVMAEIGAIQQTMRTEPASYFKNEPLQARYRMLLARKGGYGSSILGEEPAAPLVPMISRKDFAAQTGSLAHYGEYMKLVRTAADWVFALPAAERTGFVASLEALPQQVQLAAISEITERAPIVDPSSPTALANFARMPEGAVLMREWGERSGHNLALVQERLFRVIDRLEERYISTFVQWLDGLSTDCAIALYRKLAT